MIETGGTKGARRGDAESFGKIWSPPLTLPWNYNVVNDEPPAIANISTLNDRTLLVSPGSGYQYSIYLLTKVAGQKIDVLVLDFAILKSCNQADNKRSSLHVSS